MPVPVRKDAAEVSFNPFGWFPQWAATPGPAISATISKIRMPDQTLVDVCSVCPGGTRAAHVRAGGEVGRVRGGGNVNRMPSVIRNPFRARGAA